MIRLLEILKLADITRENGKWVDCNNLTVLNLLLLKLGPMSERQLAIQVVVLQSFFSIIAFFIRYCLVHLII
jgi:UDP-N-acetylglucosamine--dolichyl-phosphate N-acetylglucosaminephosphotransferase